MALPSIYVPWSGLLIHRMLGAFIEFSSIKLH